MNAPHVERVNAVLAEASQRATHWLDHLDSAAPEQHLVQSILREYYFVNRAFVYGIIRYSGRLAEVLDNRLKSWPTQNAAQMEDVLATVTKISADECQAGGLHAGKHLHHNLLLRMGPSVGLRLEDLRDGRLKPSSATCALVEFIKAHFTDQDIFVGLATVSAFESIALPMVIALRQVMGRYRSADTGLPFTDWELEHLDLHIALEVDHAAESSAIYDHVTLNADSLDTLTDTTNETVHTFDRFWKQFSAT